MDWIMQEEPCGTQSRITVLFYSTHSCTAPRDPAAFAGRKFSFGRTDHFVNPSSDSGGISPKWVHVTEARFSWPRLLVPPNEIAGTFLVVMFATWQGSFGVAWNLVGAAAPRVRAAPWSRRAPPRFYEWPCLTGVEGPWPQCWHFRVKPAFSSPFRWQSLEQYPSTCNTDWWVKGVSERRGSIELNASRTWQGKLCVPVQRH